MVVQHFQGRQNMLGVYWNRLLDKICISYTNVDIIFY